MHVGIVNISRDIIIISMNSAKVVPQLFAAAVPTKTLADSSKTVEHNYEVKLLFVVLFFGFGMLDAIMRHSLIVSKH